MREREGEIKRRVKREKVWVAVVQRKRGRRTEEGRREEKRKEERENVKIS